MPEVDWREAAAIFAGGSAGALARAALARLLAPPAGAWPWATLLANLAGTFALGYVATRLQERLPLSSWRRPLLGTGFCGALTTFSTLQLELLRLLGAHRVLLAAWYAAVSVAGGLVAVAAATLLVRRVRSIA
jgi:fluoride exporter